MGLFLCTDTSVNCFPFPSATAVGTGSNALPTRCAARRQPAAVARSSLSYRMSKQRVAHPRGTQPGLEEPTQPWSVGAGCSGAVADSLEAVGCGEDPAGLDDAAAADVLLAVLQADLPRPSLDGCRAPAQHARSPYALPALFCRAATNNRLAGWWGGTEHPPGCLHLRGGRGQRLLCPSGRGAWAPPWHCLCHPFMGHLAHPVVFSACTLTRLAGIGSSVPCLLQPTRQISLIRVIHEQKQTHPGSRISLS